MDEKIRRTAEVRWFFDGEVPTAVGQWFTTDARSPYDEKLDVLDDHYLWTGRDDVSMKLRAETLERKERVSRTVTLRGGVSGHLELWDFTSRLREPSDDVRSLVSIVEKRRLLAHFVRYEGMVASIEDVSDSDATCTLELGAVQVLSHRAWTLCLEATRADTSLVDQVLVWMVQTFPPEHVGLLRKSCSYGYPAWLLEHGKQPRVSRDEAAEMLPRMV